METEHTDEEQLRYADEQGIQIQDIYTSLEQIQKDLTEAINAPISQLKMVYMKLIRNKLDKTIDHGSYIQSDGRE